ncbi:MAG: ArsR family transcriptional regulator [Candidatus Thermoplasmatota archaeon]|nr:ArsR family transcriptional regulator [Candidatus Thermoplasmatota archaeon]
MKEDVRLFEDTDTLKVGLEQSRKKILELLKVKDMTISQIAEALERDQSTVYRHIKKLEEAGFVEVKGEKKEHHIPERIYGRTAEIFLLTPEPMDEDKPGGLKVEWKEKRVDRCLNILEEAGFECTGDEEIANELAHFLASVDEEITDNIANSISNPEEIDFFSLMQSKFLAELIKIENEESFKEELERIANKFEV